MLSHSPQHSTSFKMDQMSFTKNVDCDVELIRKFIHTKRGMGTFTPKWRYKITSFLSMTLQDFMFRLSGNLASPQHHSPWQLRICDQTWSGLICRHFQKRRSLDKREVQIRGGSLFIMTRRRR